jgi:hypothetical protein
VETADSVDLWVNRPRADDNKKVASFPAPKGGRGESQAMDLQLDAKGDMGFVLVGGRIQKFKVPKEDGPIKAEPLAFSAELNLDGAAERAYLFDHVWRQTQAKLYTTDMGGVDWAYYRQVYERQLPFVSNDEDFAELLSEMLGELNVSHTGSGYTGHPANADATAQLGAFYDSAYTGAGLKVAEVIEGSPLEAGPAPRGRRHGDREDRRRGHRPGGRGGFAAQPEGGQAGAAVGVRPGQGPALRAGGQAHRHGCAERAAVPALGQARARPGGQALGRPHRLCACARHGRQELPPHLLRAAGP